MMYREMRRKERQASQEEAIDLLRSGEYGILASTDSNNMPYAVPLSYVYADGNIYFHCALKGHKLDNIKEVSAVSFCVVGATNVLPEKFSTAFESVIIFGKAAVVAEDAERLLALNALIDKYSTNYKEEGLKYINNAAAATTVVKIEIEHLTCKKRDE